MLKFDPTVYSIDQSYKVPPCGARSTLYQFPAALTIVPVQISCFASLPGQHVEQLGFDFTGAGHIGGGDKSPVVYFTITLIPKRLHSDVNVFRRPNLQQ